MPVFYPLVIWKPLLSTTGGKANTHTTYTSRNERERFVNAKKRRGPGIRVQTMRRRGKEDLANDTREFLRLFLLEGFFFHVRERAVRNVRSQSEAFLQFDNTAFDNLKTI